MKALPVLARLGRGAVKRIICSGNLEATCLLAQAFAEKLYLGEGYYHEVKSRKELLHGPA